MTEVKKRQNDKWWIQWGFKLVWAIVPVCMGATVYILTAVYGAEKNAKDYADRQDERIVQQIDKSNKDIKDDLNRIERQMEQDRRLIIDEIKKGRE